jgi:2-polyprenyl-3-methyl-5-hydroxy-6-metoxy-1,4-benzoquinol methylase
MTATSSTIETPSVDDRLFQGAIGALELFGVYLGDRLGLYDVLRDGAPMTAPDLAARAGIDARYAREWLEQQAVAGVLAVDRDATDPDERAFRLPAQNVGAVAEPTAADHVAPLARAVVGVANVINEVVEAYRSGGGVPYARYGADFRDGQGAINRPAFTTALVDEWLPAAEGVVTQLRAGGRLADLGCGQGWSSIAVAAAFPEAEVWGIDADVASIEDARRHATGQGTEVRFEAADAAAIVSHGPFDAVLLLETLHDLSRPVDVLRAAKDALGPDGCVIVADEAVAPSFTAPGDDLERMMYGWSITHCLPAVRAEQPSAAIGTVIREDTVRTLASEAGFASCEVLPVDGGFFRIYRLTA